MDGTTSTAFALIGAGAVAAGAVGLLMPSSERLAAAALALVIGAGVGVIALAIGLGRMGVEDQTAGGRVLLIASVLGFVAVVSSLGVAWRRRAR